MAFSLEEKTPSAVSAHPAHVSGITIAVGESIPSILNHSEQMVHAVPSPVPTETEGRPGRVANRCGCLFLEEGKYLNDGAYSPAELYRSWMHNFGASEGQVGLCFTLGLFLAEYALCEHNVSGDLVYARDKWEYRGDYSSRTRPALHIELNMNEWKVFSKKGYTYYGM